MPELQLVSALQAANVKGGVAEHKFHPLRRWRFDRAWPERQVAVEIEGGVWTRGRHVRPQGFINDCEKYNAAALRGWLVLRLVPRAGWLDEAIEYIKQALRLRGASDEGVN